MKPTAPDWTWLDAGAVIAQPELARMCGLSMAELDELVDYGALLPAASGAEGRTFSGEWVAGLREAARLRATFDLDLFTLALLLGYLQRIHRLEQQVRSLQAHAGPQLLPREGPAPWREPHG